MPITLKHDIEGVDWDAVSDVYSKTLGEDAPGQLERTWSRSYAIVLAFENGRLVGVGRAISDGEREALIVGVAVLPECQGNGIGTMMMRDLIGRLGNCAVILTSSEDENTEFYHKLGFRTHKRAMVLNYPAAVLID